MGIQRVGKADSVLQELNEMYVVSINGEPWWETIVNGVTLRDRSGRKLQEARASQSLMRPQALGQAISPGLGRGADSKA